MSVCPSVWLSTVWYMCCPSKQQAPANERVRRAWCVHERPSESKVASFTAAAQRSRARAFLRSTKWRMAAAARTARSAPVAILAILAIAAASYSLSILYAAPREIERGFTATFRRCALLHTRLLACLLTCFCRRACSRLLAFALALDTATEWATRMASIIRIMLTYSPYTWLKTIPTKT